jgi:uncharacterized membrane protein YdjX (TVP38/TMEM64 family)
VSRSRLLVLVALVVLVALFFALGGHRYLTLEALRARQEDLRQYYASDPWPAVLAYFLAYVAVTGLSLPGATVLTLFGGAVFGLVWGTLIVSFASTIGATLAFLASRFLLHEWVQARCGERLRAVNEGVAREGAFYLFALRLVPAFPFFLINLAMGLTPIRTWTYYWVSQIGMLAGTVAYVYAGTQLGEFRLSVGLIAAFTLLGLFPLAAKKALDALKARRAYARWHKPAAFDRNLVVIGAGSAGLVSAYIAAAVKAKVTWSRSTAWAGISSLLVACSPRRLSRPRACSPPSGAPRSTGWQMPSRNSTLPK